MINEGDLVLLCLENGQTYLVEIGKKSFQTHRESFDLTSLIGKPYGSSLEGSRGGKAFALKPTIYDFLMKIKRKFSTRFRKVLSQVMILTRPKKMFCRENM